MPNPPNTIEELLKYKATLDKLKVWLINEAHAAKSATVRKQCLDTLQEIKDIMEEQKK